MKAIGIGTRPQAILFGLLAVLLIFVLVRWSGRARPEPAAAPLPRVAVTARPDFRAARRPRSRPATPDEIPMITEADLDPRLRSVGGDTGRDLFDMREPTPKPPPPPPTPTPAPPAPGDPRFMGPLPPPAPTPTPAPPEPPFRLVGIFGTREEPIAVLHLGDENVNARAGDVVFQRWIVRSVGYESIDVGFVGFSPAESRRLPITQ